MRLHMQFIWKKTKKTMCTLSSPYLGIHATTPLLPQVVARLLHLTLPTLLTLLTLANVNAAVGGGWTATFCSWMQSLNLWMNTQLHRSVSRPEVKEKSVLASATCMLCLYVLTLDCNTARSQVNVWKKRWREETLFLTSNHLGILMVPWKCDYFRKLAAVYKNMFPLHKDLAQRRLAEWFPSRTPRKDFCEET